MRKILITGGAGFIASSLADRLTDDDNNQVVIVDNFLTGKQDNLPLSEKNNWKVINCDVNNYNDIAPVMMSYSFDFVFHYAAVVGVRRTLDNPILVLNDIDGIKNILELSKNTGVKRVIYASSSEVYGESIAYPQDEHVTPLNSRLPYAVVKNVGEAFCKSYKQTYNLDYTIFRFFNTYGPKQSLDFVVSKFIMQALKSDDLTVHGDGSQSRTFCYISDNIEATMNSFRNRAYMNDVVNIGNDVEVSIHDLASAIIDVTGSSSKIVHLPPRKEGDMQRRVPHLGKMRKLITNPHISLYTGIEKLLSSSKFAV